VGIDPVTEEISMHLSRLVPALTVIAGLALTPGAAASERIAHDDGPPAAAPASAFVPGELIVRYRAGVGEAEQAATRRGEGLTLEDESGARLELVEIAPGQSVEQAARELERQPEIAFAEPNHYRELHATTNDPYFADGSLWGLHNTGQTANGDPGVADADMDIPEAWDRTMGSSRVTVAVVDTGVDYTHPELNDNTWTNAGEMGSDAWGYDKRNNRRDDDGNGYVDDWYGWDFGDMDNDAIAAPFYSGTHGNTDVGDHGTHVAGTIGARGNNGYGVTGVSPNVKLMPLRVFSNNATAWRLADAFRYAARNGARVVNASLGGRQSSQSELSAIRENPNTLFVISAGNESNDNDVAARYPCNYDAENVICVAASNPRDELAADFSNYGATTVDVAAPGTNILSTWARNYTQYTWGWKDGTSMAAPQVSGVAALLLAVKPGATATELRRAILAGVDRKAALAGKVASGGRLNADGALAELLSPGSRSGQSGGGAGGGNGAGSGSGAAPSDRTAPAILTLAATSTRFRAARRGPSAATAVGTTVRYRLTEAAAVRFTIVRKVRGRAVRMGSFTLRGRAGRNSFGLTGRLKGRRLAPGRYQLVALATDVAGNRSVRERVDLRIVR
jgi:subtilisin family serine protease